MACSGEYGEFDIISKNAQKKKRTCLPRNVFFFVALRFLEGQD